MDIDALINKTHMVLSPWFILQTADESAGEKRHSSRLWEISLTLTEDVKHECVRKRKLLYTHTTPQKLNTVHKPLLERKQTTVSLHFPLKLSCWQPLVFFFRRYMICPFRYNLVLVPCRTAVIMTNMATTDVTIILKCVLLMYYSIQVQCVRIFPITSCISV